MYAKRYQLYYRQKEKKSASFYTAPSLGQLANNIGMSRAQAAIHSPRLAVDIASLVTTQEQRHTGNLVGVATAPRGIQLANLLLGAAGAGGVVHGRRHARLNQAGADGVDADAGAGELVGNGLRERDDGSLGRRVGRRAGVGADAGDRGGADDAAVCLGLFC